MRPAPRTGTASSISPPTIVGGFPGPGLEKIQARLLAVNFADDLINPPELGILEREIKRVKRGKAVVMPMTDQTRGHGTHTLAAVWKEHLVAFMKETERP